MHHAKRVLGEYRRVIELSILHWRCGYDGTANYGDYRAWYTFNTPLEMHVMELSQPATGKSTFLSILHWRCEAPKEVPPNVAMMADLSILHWRCLLFRLGQSFAVGFFQYSIGDAQDVEP